MLKITITPKTQIPGSFFLDHDNAIVYKTNCVSITHGCILFMDCVTNTCFDIKMDSVNNFYDITEAW